jgi:hypothetical protein
MRNQRFKDFFKDKKELEEVEEIYKNTRDMSYLFEILHLNNL